ncbi:MAG: hypothetical protein ACK55I_14905, partial [bacterium]
PAQSLTPPADGDGRRRGRRRPSRSLPAARPPRGTLPERPVPGVPRDFPGQAGVSDPAVKA